MTPPLIYGVVGILLGCIGTGLLGVVCARVFAQRLRQELVSRLQDHERSLLKALSEQEVVPSLNSNLDENSITQRIQKALQVEIKHLSLMQLERDESLAQKQRQWRAEQDVRHAKEFRALLEALQARGDKAAMPPAAATQTASPRSAPAPMASLPAAISARPPELTHAPLPRAGIEAAPSQPELELSDEEIDALPPELPTLAKPRKRILPAPKKPPLQRI